MAPSLSTSLRSLLWHARGEERESSELGLQPLRAFLAAPAQRERRSGAAQELSLDHVLLLGVGRVQVVARQKRGQNCLKRGPHSHSQPPTKMARALESLRTGRSAPAED